MRRSTQVCVEPAVLRCRVQVHDVFVPYFVPGDGAQTIGSPTSDKPGIRYNDCVAHGFTPEGLEPEIECVRGKTRDVIA